MQLEQQVVSLELSKQLKEAGYPQEGLWWWGRRTAREDTPASKWDIFWYKDVLSPYAPYPEVNEIYVAPTVAELGEALPVVVNGKHGYGQLIMTKFGLNRDGIGHNWGVIYEGTHKKIRVNVLDFVADEPTLASAMAKMWLYLKKEGLL